VKQTGEHGQELSGSAPRAAVISGLLAWHGWLGLSLVGAGWALNWLLPGLRTHWGFFPLWLGYCLLVDALVLRRTGTSLLTRSRAKYAGLFLVSAPAWWLFEAINLRTQNWVYLGADAFTPQAYAFWASLSFSTVIPAVFGTAELLRSTRFIQKLGPGPILRPDRRTSGLFFAAGLVMLALMMAWPIYFFPFVWLSVYFILEPLNVWLGNRTLAEFTGRGDWRPVVALWAGVLICGFFWEMWNFYSYPKWIYQVPFVSVGHIFEMPFLGYGGYLPFALELHALYSLVRGLLGDKKLSYLRLYS
jgi:hypothetical protein